MKNTAPTWRFRHVAIACPGLGHVHRGYESIVAELFCHIRDRVPTTLFKGAGAPMEDERRLRCLRRTSVAGRAAAFLTGRRPYELECVGFARRLHAALTDGDFGLVYVPDLDVARDLLALRGRRPSAHDYSIVFHNGAPHGPEKLHGFDVVQQVTKPAQLEAEQAGIRTALLLPIPIDVEKFAPGPPDPYLRRALGLADGPVVLCVAAHEKTKRIDLLIDALAGEPGPAPGEDLLPQLLVVGQQGRQTQCLRVQAAQRLGSRARFATVPYERMPQLYGLADLFVLPSDHEGFGMVLLEAMASGVPIVTQRDAVREWLVGDSGSLVECSDMGTFRGELARLIGDPDARRALADAGLERARRHFSWPALLPRYLELFEKASAAAD